MIERAEWTVEDHLAAGDERTVALWRRFAAVLEGFGPVTVSVSKTTVTFKGSRRGFAGARPTATGLVGYFDLMRALPADRRIRSSSPYGRKLFVHQFRLTGDDDLDAEFVGWLEEAHAVGCCAHLA
ncbi:DUF5655 domain-containing protein [Microbacterium sp. Root180]|uniref:DUF5655 domain-containing protein n=1 Tax=Microbacterium sp. Root180 TaxID=1736483 RepID=UPI0006FD9B69|nr:DUF5655 domain-containing protein [Microbacterium sp. Root180]KRB36098.1 hypothetical protein ASD93_08250 [Microbacterium sp. Root180]